ncbi:hypothetical protein [Oricola thermophila]|uniref:Uncharacterized protein n=1 Tax=Oricola thermophila TaxID=2742145 RepID=A0A6N1VIX4_9HYPH|nr:hypothetical protein [Oricola thermophila]QKV18887.1 hypothetical protein HTY61_10715 [Oricola thermophila]
MSRVERLKNGTIDTPMPAASDLEVDGNDIAASEGLDELENEIVMQLEKEFGGKDDAAKAESALPKSAPAEATPEAAVNAAMSDFDTSSRQLEMRRKREMASAMEEQIHDGARIFGGLAKQAATLSDYLEKMEAEMKRLERIEASSTKLRIASEGLIRNNHEMKATIEEQRKKVALLESKVASLRDANEAARTNLARLAEEKRIMGVDLDAAKSEIARLENDKRAATERSERSEEEVRELKTNLTMAKDREKVMAIEMRKLEDDLSRRNAEIEELRDRKTQFEIEIEELKSRNATVETTIVEQRSRIEELTFELKSSRKEMEEVIRLKQQRILELEARNRELGAARQEFDEAMTPSIALGDDDDSALAPSPAKPRAKPATKPASKTGAKSAPKSASRQGTRSQSRSTGKQPVKAG